MIDLASVTAACERSRSPRARSTDPWCSSAIATSAGWPRERSKPAPRSISGSASPGLPRAASDAPSASGTAPAAFSVPCSRTSSVACSASIRWSSRRPSSPAMSERQASDDAPAGHCAPAGASAADSANQRSASPGSPRKYRPMPTAQQAAGRQGDPGPSSSAARRPLSSWAPTSPHGQQARSIVRLAPAELKPSGRVPPPGSPSRPAAAMT